MKTCSICKEDKKLSEFGFDKRKPDGHKYQCKCCHNAQNTAYRTAKPENHRKVNLAYARSPAGKAKQRANSLRRKFWPQMTNEQAVAEYDRLLAIQKNCCGLCGIHQSLLKTSLAVDHCHETKSVRGLLCNKCNRFEVGRHTIESMRRMMKYFGL